MAIVAWLIVGIMAVIMLFFWRKINIQEEEIWEKNRTINYLKETVSRLKPAHPCMARVLSPTHRAICMRPATHVYAELKLCDECAQNFGGKEVNRPPVPFDFEKQKVIAE